MDARAEVTQLLDEVCGYRTVRLLSVGSTATTLLVHAAEESFAARVLHENAPAGVLERELSVSDAAAQAGGALARHLSLVCDLGSLADGRLVLLSSYVAGPRLDTLLAARGADLALGEAVTLLAPIAALVHEAHRVGVTGLTLTAASIRVSTTGAPVITRRQGARLGPVLPERFRDRDAAYPDDFGALERLGGVIASAVGVHDRPHLLSLLRQRGVPLEHALFDLADPIPLRVAMVAAPVGQGFDDTTRVTVERALPARVPATATRLLAEPSGAVGSQPPHSHRAVAASILTAVKSLGLPERLVTAADDALHRAATVTQRARAFVARRLPGTSGSVRPRFIVAGVAGVAALMIAIAAITVSSDTPPRSELSTSGVEAPNPGSTPGANEGASHFGAQGDDLIGAPETELQPDDESWHRIVRELMGRWVDCVGQHSADESAGIIAADGGARDCQHAIVHAGSAAEALIAAADDRHELLSGWYRAGGAIVIVERMGGAVLIDLMTSATTTASLLVVRSEAGWRVRDVIG